MRRANVWASALSETPKRIPWGTVVTSYGYVSIDDWSDGFRRRHRSNSPFAAQRQIRLGVIHYVRPLRSFIAVLRIKKYEVEIAGRPFPVVIRPWLPIWHSSAKPVGNCWIKLADGRPAILTALHAIRPKSAKRGSWVAIDVFRTPRKGRLIKASAKMDAAIVQLDSSDWHGKKIAVLSRIIGYKPVRLLSNAGPVDGRIKEHTGATIFAAPGEEPLAPNYLFIDQSLIPGDSGCLILDCEHDDLPQYLMYLGKTVLDNNNEVGIGLLLQQPKLIWAFDVFS